MVAPKRKGRELITDENDRKMRFRKRKNSIYKKADELSKLCDIDICLIIYEADQKKGKPIQPETWPQDPNEFNRILNKYKAAKGVLDPGLERNFDSSDFNEAKKKDVDPIPQKSGRQISEDKYPTWDNRIDLFSYEELTKLIGSLEAKIQASTNKIDSIVRSRVDAKRNQDLLQEESRKSRTPHHKMVKLVDLEQNPTKYDVQQPYQDPADQKSNETEAFNENAINSTTSAMQLMPPKVHYPMFPSAWI